MPKRPSAVAEPEPVLADDELVDPASGDARGEEPARRAVPAWIISIAVHGALLMLFGFVLLVKAQLEEETPPVKVTAIETPPPRPQEKIERTIEQTDMALDVEAPESDQVSPMSELDVPVETYSREEDVDSDVPKGREEAIADSEMGGEGGFMAIGAGGGASGMFGSRTGGGKKRALGRFGGSKGSENAVDAALRWFKKHQGADGAWHATSYQGNCADVGAKCEPGQNHRNGPKEDGGLTGLALLCYLGAGYDHRMPSKYKATVKKGLDWLVAMQTQDGSFIDGAFNYEQAIATMALCEAYAMSNDPTLKGPAQKGVDAVLARRAKATPAAVAAGPKGAYGATGLAWGDFVNTESNKMHTSACGWNVQALKSARAAGLDVRDGIDGARIWLEGLWRGTCKLEGKDPAKLDPYQDESTLSYYWNGETLESTDLLPIANNLHNLACIGLLCGVFMGEDAGGAMLQTLANHVDRHNVPTRYPCNIYYAYYGTFGMFMLGGQRWDRWNNVVRDMLVKAQRAEPGSCFDGSWDFDPHAHYGAEVGRLLSTALCCLTLEVYYRYLPVSAHDAKGKAAPASAKPGKDAKDAKDAQ